MFPDRHLRQFRDPYLKLILLYLSAIISEELTKWPFLYFSYYLIYREQIIRALLSRSIHYPQKLQLQISEYQKITLKIGDLCDSWSVHESELELTDVHLTSMSDKNISYQRIHSNTS